jgi:hypothetical protein
LRARLGVKRGLGGGGLWRRCFLWSKGDDGRMVNEGGEGFFAVLDSIETPIVCICQGGSCGEEVWKLMLQNSRCSTPSNSPMASNGSHVSGSLVIV